MANDKKDLAPASTSNETVLDVAAFVSSAVPWVGGPISNVLQGMSLGRKLARVREVLEGVVQDLQNFRSEVSEKYVKTDEFEELLERTLRQAAEERNREKRDIYRNVLIGAIRSPGEDYEDQVRLLRTLEHVQQDHLRVLHALSQEPTVDSAPFGSAGQTLCRRLPDLSRDRIEGLVNDLNDLRLTNLTAMRVMMTAHGAQDLRHWVTSFGQRLLRFTDRSAGGTTNAAKT